MDLTLCRSIFANSGVKTCFVGFSGGADSTAALLAARDWREHGGGRVVAVHCDHGLRGAESDAEAVAAERFAAKIDVEFRLEKLSVPRIGNLEAAARDCRLQVWKRLCGGVPGSAVVLGHHADDRLENLFLRAGRGGNTSSLANLRSLSVVDGVVFLRPLLGFSRLEIEAFLRACGIVSWASDSSNLDCRLLRNWMRLKMLPEFFRRSPGGRSGVLKTLDALECDAVFIENCAANYYASGNPEQLDFWLGAAPALLPRLLRRALSCFCGKDQVVSAATLARLHAILGAAAERRDRGGALKLPCGNGTTLIFERGYVFFVVSSDDTACKSAPSEAAPVCWRWREAAEVRWGDWQVVRLVDDAAESSSAFDQLPDDRVVFDAETLPDQLVLRASRSGETMTPFGRNTPVKLKKLRVDRGVPAFPARPVLAGPDGVALWFAGVRRSSAFPVGKRYGSVVFFQLISTK